MILDGSICHEGPSAVQHMCCIHPDRGTVQNVLTRRKAGRSDGLWCFVLGVRGGGKSGLLLVGVELSVSETPSSSFTLTIKVIGTILQVHTTSLAFVMALIYIQIILKIIHLEILFSLFCHCFCVTFFVWISCKDVLPYFNLYRG